MGQVACSSCTTQNQPLKITHARKALRKPEEFSEHSQKPQPRPSRRQNLSLRKFDFALSMGNGLYL
ncbi:MAG: hypothetical protein EA369_09390 [Bradymonadales bacterium]|nr:MAG: hypothetical protein EA369_09390 [Bradymonadales bacterium]